MLNADLSGVDTAFPVIQAGTISGIIAKCEQGLTKEKHKPVLNFEITAAHPVVTTKGQTKPAGWLFRHMVSLTPTYESDGTTARYDPRQSLKQIKEAVFGDGSGPFGDPASYVGKPVTFNIKVESSAEFGDQNRIARFIKPQV